MLLKFSIWEARAAIQASICIFKTQGSQHYKLVTMKMVVWPIVFQLLMVIRY